MISYYFKGQIRWYKYHLEKCLS